MALILRRNGTGAKSDTERLAEVRERIRTDFGRIQEDAPIYLEQFRQRIHKYERRYEMTSEAMMDALEAGELRETQDIHLWTWTWLTLNRMKEATHTTGTP